MRCASSKLGHDVLEPLPPAAEERDDLEPAPDGGRRRCQAPRLDDAGIPLGRVGEVGEVRERRIDPRVNLDLPAVAHSTMVGSGRLCAVGPRLR